ncbi:MAG TPA: diacylglycerol kinase family protein [Tissierellales bacterium]|nr:diacylglycerol kinase family protein [Tissierellales bacterium]
MDKILFIVNPIAGGGRAKDYIPIIKEVMKENNKDYNIVNTKAPKEAIALTVEGVKSGYTVIVAVGGDGTINEVAEGLIMSKSNSLLAVIPGGTGNDSARTLNVPRNPYEALNLLVKGESKEIDIAFVNDRIFLNIASVGLDSEIVKNAETIKKRVKGKVAYLISVFRTLFIYRNKKVKVQIDDKSLDEDIILLAVANGKYYGGGLKICPDALMGDGYFHVCIVKKIPKLKIFFLFPTMFKGLHTKFEKYVKIHKAKRIKIMTDEDAYLNIDGEIYDISKETMFTIGDRRLQIVC